MKNLAVILPARNKAEALRRLLPELTAVLPEAEIIVVNDGSDDDTLAVCAEFPVRVVSHSCPKGNGAAIKSGARAAKGNVLIFMDADGQHKPEDIPALLEKFAEGHDMVVGARQSGSHAGPHRAVAHKSIWSDSIDPQSARKNRCAKPCNQAFRPNPHYAVCRSASKPLSARCTVFGKGRAPLLY